MCGRYTLGERPDISEHLQLRFPLLDWRASHNVAPAQTVLAVVDEGDGRAAQLMRWGFQPGWFKPSAKQPPPINARAETLAERPMFRGAVAKGRCLIPADGFYEWQARHGQRTKQPMYIRLKDASIFTFAGLYTVRQDGDGAVWSCAIVTTTANSLMEPIHNRMPVILEREAAALWLDPTVTDPAAVVPLLQPYPAERMEAWPVRMLVSAVRNDGPELIERLPT